MRLRNLIWLAALWPLAGCLGEAGLGGASQDPPARAVAPELALYDGAVVVRGPRGYCVDKNSLRRQAGNRLVLLGSCESLTGELGVSAPPALIVVNVSSRRQGRIQPTAAAIAASAAPKTAIEAIDGDGVAIVHLEAGGDLALPGGDPRYWRAGLVINDHYVSLAIYGPKGSSLAGTAGKRLIIDLAESLREASPARRYLPPDTTPAPASDTVAPATRGKSSLLSGLFPNSG